MLRLRTVVVAACLLWNSAYAAAQVLLEPEPAKANQKISCGKYDNPASPLSDLRDHYTAGRWTQLIAQTKEILDQCAFVAEENDTTLFATATGATAAKPDYKRDWYLIVIATVDHDDKPLLLRYVLHDPLPYPYTNHTLGVPRTLQDTRGVAPNDVKTSRLVQVFLSPNKALDLDTAIQVTETADPLKDQIADVVKAVFDPAAVIPLLKGLTSPAIRGANAPSAVTGPVVASVGRIHPPFDRADFKYTDVVRAATMFTANASLSLREKFDTQAEATMKVSDAAEKAAAEAVKTEADTRNSSTASPDEKARTVARRDAAIALAGTRRLDAELAAALAVAGGNYLRGDGGKACDPATYREGCLQNLITNLENATTEFCVDHDYCKTDRDDLMLLKFKEAAEPAKTPPTPTTTTLANIPYQHLSFGTLGAYIARASASRDRVKVDSGKVVADPVGRALTSVVLNLHGAFDPKAPNMETAERWRGFVGAVLTPNLGISVGAGYGVLRTLSLNIGYALMVIPTLRDGDAIDSAPLHSTRPFRAGAAHVAFFGLGYKFGK